MRGCGLVPLGGFMRSGRGGWMSEGGEVGEVGEGNLPVDM